MAVDNTRIPAVRLPRFLPPGPLALAVIAVAVVPILYRELVKEGKKLNKNGESEEEKKKQAEKGTSKTAAEPKTDVNKGRTTKRGKGAGGVDVTTASPPGQEEVEEHAAAEMEGAAAPPKSSSRKRTTTEKAPAPDQPKNPKRTRKTKGQG